MASATSNFWVYLASTASNEITQRLVAFLKKSIFVLKLRSFWQFFIATACWKGLNLKLLYNWIHEQVVVLNHSLQTVQTFYQQLSPLSIEVLIFIVISVSDIRMIVIPARTSCYRTEFRSWITGPSLPSSHIHEAANDKPSEIARPPEARTYNFWRICWICSVLGHCSKQMERLCLLRRPSFETAKPWETRPWFMTFHERFWRI